jgi:hypothetical protein
MEILDMRFGGVEVGTLLVIAAGCWVVYRIKRWWGIRSSIRYISKQIDNLSKEIDEVDRNLESGRGDAGVYQYLYQEREKYYGLLHDLRAQLNK